MNNTQANEIKIGAIVTGAQAIEALQTFKIRNTEDPNFTFWFNDEGELIGHGTAGAPLKRNRDISYFMSNTFEVIATIAPPFVEGDYVEVTSDKADLHLENGEVVRIDAIRDGKVFPYRVKKEDGTTAVVTGKVIRRMTEEEVKKHLEASNKAKINALSEGDIVKVAKDAFNSSELKVGDLAVVVRQDLLDSELPVRISPVGADEDFIESEWARHYEVEIPTKEEIEEAKAIVKVSEAPEGTLIRITGRDATKPKYGDHGKSNGTVIKVSRKRAGSKDAIRGFVDHTGGSKGTFEYTVHGGDFEILTKDEINAHEAKKLNLSKGAYLVVTTKGAGEIEVGTVVVSDGNQYSGGVEVNDLEGKHLGFKYAYNLRQAEASEVEKAKEATKEAKARKMFDKLGRYYGQIKAGDIVRVTDHLGGDFKVGEVAEAQNENGLAFRVVLQPNNPTQKGRYAEVELITPVEQRLDK